MWLQFNVMPIRTVQQQSAEALFILTTSSADFDRFKTKSLSFAHSSMWSRSGWQDLTYRRMALLDRPHCKLCHDIYKLRRISKLNSKYRFCNISDSKNRWPPSRLLRQHHFHAMIVLYSKVLTFLSLLVTNQRVSGSRNGSNFRNLTWRQEDVVVTSVRY